MILRPAKSVFKTGSTERRNNYGVIICVFIVLGELRADIPVGRLLYSEAEAHV